MYLYVGCKRWIDYVCKCAAGRGGREGGGGG